MSLQVEKLEHNMAKLTVEVAAEDVEKALQAAYLKQRKQINIPGFRKGKVPRQMIEKMYGPEVFYDEAANNMIPDAYAKAYDESELDIVSQPKIEVVQMEKGKPFIFTAEVATKPEVTLGDYKGLKVDKVSTRVTQKEVDEEIEKERERNARTIEVTDRAVQDKDEVTLDFEGFVDGVAFEGGKGEDYPLTIGSGSFIPGFEEQLIGAETATPTVDKYYRTRKSWADSKSQIGAYKSLENAKKEWKQGYTIYDWNGKAVYPVQTSEKAVVLTGKFETQLPIIRKGNSGVAVSVLQSVLGVTVDGHFGDDTETSLKVFQKNTGVKVSGTCGIDSWKRVIEHMKANTHN